MKDKRITKKCLFCGGEFLTITGQAKFDSPDCARKFRLRMEKHIKEISESAKNLDDILKLGM